MVERTTVNRVVVGSIPTLGAKFLVGEKMSDIDMPEWLERCRNEIEEKLDPGCNNYQCCFTAHPSFFEGFNACWTIADEHFKGKLEGKDKVISHLRDEIVELEKQVFGDYSERPTNG